jgi:hypothetical protein
MLYRRRPEWHGFFSTIILECEWKYGLAQSGSRCSGMAKLMRAWISSATHLGLALSL